MSITTYKSKETVKTTLNLSRCVQNDMKELVQQKIIKNQTEFINYSLKKSISDIKRKAVLNSLKQKIHSVKRIQSNVSILDTLDEIRKESLQDT